MSNDEDSKVVVGALGFERHDPSAPLAEATVESVDTESGTITLSEAAPVEEVKDLTPEQIQALNKIIALSKARTLKQKLQGVPGTATPRVWQCWYMGNLITREESDKLTQADREASKRWEANRLADKKAERRK